MNRRKALQAMGVLSVAPLVGKSHELSSVTPLSARFGVAPCEPARLDPSRRPVGTIFKSDESGNIYWTTGCGGKGWTLVRENVPIPMDCWVKIGRDRVLSYRPGFGRILCLLSHEPGVVGVTANGYAECLWYDWLEIESSNPTVYHEGHFGERPYDVCPPEQIECLQYALRRQQSALRLAAGELSTHEPHTGKHPQEVYDELLTAAREFQEPPHV